MSLTALMETILIANSEFRTGEITGGVDPLSPIGITIIIIGIIFTIGLPLIMIAKGRKN